MQGYSSRQVSNMLKIPESRVRSFAKAGLCGSKEKKSLRFDFRDMLVLRMAKELADQGLGHRQVQRALRSLRETLPAGRSLSGLKLRLSGRKQRVVACEGDNAWDAESGQYQLPLYPPRSTGGSRASTDPPDNLAILRPEPEDEVDGTGSDGAASMGDDVCPESAQGWFDIGVSLEDDDAERAYQAYLRALASDPMHPESMINLGRLCSAVGEATRAASYFRLAALVDPRQAIAHFNLGVTLHDLGELEQAVAAYSQALECDPDLVDAHYNLATVLEERGEGDSEAALRHMAAYRRLVERPTD